MPLQFSTKLSKQIHYNAYIGTVSESGLPLIHSQVILFILLVLINSNKND
jgi:hypothetical protein